MFWREYKVSDVLFNKIYDRSITNDKIVNLTIATEEMRKLDDKNIQTFQNKFNKYK
jgi:hypothetical protein